MKDQDKFWELASAKLHNEISEEDLAEFDVFLKDEKYKTFFNEIKELKDDSMVIWDLKRVSENRSWTKISTQLRQKTIHLVWNLAKYAAIIVLAFMLGGVITNKFYKKSDVSGYAEVKVPLGQMTELTLFDGTQVWLNSGSTLRYSNEFGEDERSVSLEGEAFFDVIKNGKPFKVKFKNKEVEVLGTQFNVVAYADETTSQITLVEGSVNVNTQNGTTIAKLEASEQININELTQKATLKKVETKFYVEWKRGKIVFEEEKLSEISKKLERWYNVDIRFEDESMLDMDFSGTILKNKPFDQIMKAYEILLPIKIKYTHVPGEKDIVFISNK